MERNVKHEPLVTALLNAIRGARLNGLCIQYIQAVIPALTASVRPDKRCNCADHFAGSTFNFVQISLSILSTVILK